MCIWVVGGRVPVTGMLAGMNLSKPGMNLSKPGMNLSKPGKKHHNLVIMCNERYQIQYMDTTDTIYRIRHQSKGIQCAWSNKKSIGNLNQEWHRDFYVHFSFIHNCHPFIKIKTNSCTLLYDNAYKYAFGQQKYLNDINSKIKTYFASYHKDIS